MRALRIASTVLVLGVLGAGYAVLGFYQVAPDEQAVVLRLGRYHRTIDPGSHFRWWGLETVEKGRVTVTQKEEFGYRTTAAGPPPTYEDRPEEKVMISEDENLVNVEFVLQYRIVDLADYLFNVRDVQAVLRDAARAAMREVVAKSKVNDVLTEDKGPIEDEGRVRIQEILDAYGAGLRIQRVQLQDVEPPDPVKDAFADVAGAQQDRERLILEARGYAEQVVPRARGEAQELLNQARADRETRIRRSEGEAQRFRALLAEYRKAPVVTRERLYLETLEAILPHMEKVIIQDGRSEKVLPYLPLGRRESAK